MATPIIPITPPVASITVGNPAVPAGAGMATSIAANTVDNSVPNQFATAQDGLPVQDGARKGEYGLTTSSTELQRLRLQTGLYDGGRFVLGHLREGYSVLDVGSGTGDHALQMARIVGPRGRVIGIDTDEPKVNFAHELTVLEGLNNITFEKGDAYQLQYTDSIFDVVHLRMVLMHMIDPVKILKEVLRVLKPGGKIVVVDSVDKLPLFSPIAAKFEEVRRKFLQVIESSGADWSIGSRLEKLLADVGFVDIASTKLPTDIRNGDDPTLFSQYLNNTIPLVGRNGSWAKKLGENATPEELDEAQTELRLLQDNSDARFHKLMIGITGSKDNKTTEQKAYEDFIYDTARTIHEDMLVEWGRDQEPEISFDNYVSPLLAEYLKIRRSNTELSTESLVEQILSESSHTGGFLGAVLTSIEMTIADMSLRGEVIPDAANTDFPDYKKYTAIDTAEPDINELETLIRENLPATSGVVKTLIWEPGRDRLEIDSALERGEEVYVFELDEGIATELKSLYQDKITFIKARHSYKNYFDEIRASFASIDMDTFYLLLKDGGIGIYQNSCKGPRSPYQFDQFGFDMLWQHYGRPVYKTRFSKYYPVGVETVVLEKDENWLFDQI